MSSTIATRVLILQVVANDLPCQSRPPASDESEAKHILIVAGTLTATVKRAGGHGPTQTENIEPGDAHAFQLGRVGVDLFLTHDGVRKRVPYAVPSSCGRLYSQYIIGLTGQVNSFSHQRSSHPNPTDGK
jgi:hypothetical protein